MCITLRPIFTSWVLASAPVLAVDFVIYFGVLVIHTFPSPSHTCHDTSKIKANGLKEIV